MDQQHLIEKTKELVARDLELEETTEPLDEEKLLQLIADRVAYLIEHNIELVFSSLYRLDVDERKVEKALMPGNPIPANVALATLILERQKKRVKTKSEYKQEDLTDWEW